MDQAHILVYTHMQMLCHTCRFITLYCYSKLHSYIIFSFSMPYIYPDTYTNIVDNGLDRYPKVPPIDTSKSTANRYPKVPPIDTRKYRR